MRTDPEKLCGYDETSVLDLDGHRYDLELCLPRRGNDSDGALLVFIVAVVVPFLIAWFGACLLLPSQLASALLLLPVAHPGFHRGDPVLVLVGWQRRESLESGRVVRGRIAVAVLGRRPRGRHSSRDWARLEVERREEGDLLLLVMLASGREDERTWRGERRAEELPQSGQANEEEGQIDGKHVHKPASARRTGRVKRVECLLRFALDVVIVIPVIQRPIRWQIHRDRSVDGQSVLDPMRESVARIRFDKVVVAFELGSVRPSG